MVIKNTKVAWLEFPFNFVNIDDFIVKYINLCCWNTFHRNHS